MTDAAIPFGQYELIERIAEGGMAEVWRARSRGVAGFEKTVVIKRVLPALLERPGFAELLVREAKIAARLSHPNVVQIFDLGEREGSYFIAMEYLRGRDLAAAMSFRATAETPGLSLGLRLYVAAEVAKALDYAHRARGDDGKPMHIVHRDVSPQNVLLGFEGEVKVADFGIARADEPGLGRGEDPKVLRGKYAYMSPEQARGEQLDRRSDIFSLGVLVYELASRRRMFRGQSSTEVLASVRAAQLPEWRSHVELTGLVPLLERALAPDRDGRPDSALELHDGLLRILFGLGEPVGQTDLARAMQRMFPETDHVDPNKLRVDLLERAYDDASSTSGVGRMQEEPTVQATARTRAMPTSKRLRSEIRRLAYLVVQARPGEEPLFEGAVQGAGGEPLVSRDGMRLALFGLAGAERAAGHAARAALELRRGSRLEGSARVDPIPPMVVLVGDTRVIEGAVAEPSDELVARAWAMLADTSAGDIRVEEALDDELRRDFRLDASGAQLRLDGFRSRRDRDAGALRGRSPLVGRRGVLQRLSAELLEAAKGQGQLVHLVGEPGVGKSRLLAELRGAAAPRDFVFVHGRADDADQGRSFGALADLILDLCGIEPEDAPAQRFEKIERLRVLGLGARQVLVAGELIGIHYPVASPERVGRPRGIELALAIRRAVQELSRERVVVLALEDLQWMDDATRQVLPLVVEGLVGGRVLVLLTRRPGSAGPLPSGGRTIDIPPLDRDATGRLLAHHLGARAVEPELAAWVHVETGGIPAWIELVAGSLASSVIIEHEVARRRDGSPARIPLPDSVRGSVSARLERLRGREQSMLRAVAVLGGAAEVSMLSAIEGLVGHTERPPLRRLWIKRLLVSGEDDDGPPDGLGAWGGDEGDERLPTRVRLPSELTRRAILAELEPEELERLHGRIVATLERLGLSQTLDGCERLAHHAERASDRRRASDYLVRAGELALAEGHPTRASAHLADAAKVLREDRGDPSDLDAFELGLRAVDAALEAGQSELAGRALAPLVAAGDRVPSVAKVERAIGVARCARLALDSAAAVAALAEVREHIAEAPAEVRDRAFELLGAALLELGENERALEVLDAQESEATLGLRAVALVRTGRLEDADDTVGRALALAARTGEVHRRYVALAALARLEEARGAPAVAAERLREAAEVGAQAHAGRELATLHARAAIAALRADDDRGATLSASAAAREAERRGDEVWLQVVHAIRAALAIREHPDASYVPGLVRAVDHLEARDQLEAAALGLEMLVHAHLALDDPGAASRTLARASEVAERAGDRSHAGRLRAWAVELT